MKKKLQQTLMKILCHSKAAVKIVCLMNEKLQVSGGRVGRDCGGGYMDPCEQYEDKVAELHLSHFKKEKT